jgi:hypothetical protein
MKKGRTSPPFKDPPCEVTFKYPKGERPPKKGNVIAATHSVIHPWRPVPYATRIELIKFNDTKEKHIRFAYRRRAKGRWYNASQTTWTFSVAITRSAIKEAEKLGLFSRA